MKKIYFILLALIGYSLYASDVLDRRLGKRLAVLFGQRQLPQDRPSPPQYQPPKNFTKSNNIKMLAATNQQVRLTNINPAINKWFLLQSEADPLRTFHIENVHYFHQVSLMDSGLSIQTDTHIIECTLWNNSDFDLFIEDFSTIENPFFPLCNGLLYLRLRRKSNTQLSLTELTTDFLRSKQMGEGIINYFKPLLVKWSAENANLIKPQSASSTAIKYQSAQQIMPKTANTSDYQTISHNLGFSTIKDKRAIQLGDWYDVTMHKDIYTSVHTPGLADKDYDQSHNLPPISLAESDKLIYLTAFDLAKYTVRYIMGTQHPGLISQAGDKNKAILPNIVPIGSIPPYDLEKAVSVFTGGFKHRHSKFKYGPHRGKQFGYIENGVIITPLQPGLATIYATVKGDIDIQAWPQEKTASLNLTNCQLSRE